LSFGDLTATAGRSFDLESSLGKAGSHQSAFEIGSSDDSSGGDPHDGVIEGLEDIPPIFDHFDQIFESDEPALDRGLGAQSKSQRDFVARFSIETTPGNRPRISPARPDQI